MGFKNDQFKQVDLLFIGIENGMDDLFVIAQAFQVLQAVFINGVQLSYTALNTELLI